MCCSLDATKLRFLLQNGADITTKDGNLFTPIQIAAQRFDEPDFQKVLKTVLETRDLNVKIQFPWK